MQLEELTIDLILSTNPDFVFDVIISEPFGGSDHNSVLFKVNIQNKKIKDLPFRNFRKTDYDAINGFFLTVDWNTIFSHYFSAKDLYSYFLELVKTVCSSCQL